MWFYKLSLRIPCIEHKINEKNFKKNRTRRMLILKIRKRQVTFQGYVRKKEYHEKYNCCRTCSPNSKYNQNLSISKIKQHFIYIIYYFRYVLRTSFQVSGWNLNLKLFHVFWAFCILITVIKVFQRCVDRVVSACLLALVFECRVFTRQCVSRQWF